MSKAPSFRSFSTTKPKDITRQAQKFRACGAVSSRSSKISAPAAGGEEAGSFLSLGGVSSDCPFAGTRCARRRQLPKPPMPTSGGRSAPTAIARPNRWAEAKATALLPQEPTGFGRVCVVRHARRPAPQPPRRRATSSAGIDAQCPIFSAQAFRGPHTQRLDDPSRVEVLLEGRKKPPRTKMGSSRVVHNWIEKRPVLNPVALYLNPVATYLNPIPEHRRNSYLPID